MMCNDLHPDLSANGQNPQRPHGALQLLQLSDCHLYDQAEQDLAGLNTLDTLKQVVELAVEYSPEADLVLATGDIAHEASVAAYAQAAKQFKPLPAPVHCCPGNHDDPKLMARHLPHPPTDHTGAVILGDWIVILLDSTRPGDPGGHLSRRELERLDDSLGGHPHLHALIGLHHHPVPIGSSWMDRIALDNPEALFSVIDRHHNVKGVAWGHIHQRFDSQRNGVKLMGAPSTCVQFMPRQSDFTLDAEPPGFRWIDLLPDGEIRSGVIRLAHSPAGLNLTSTGY